MKAGYRVRLFFVKINFIGWLDGWVGGWMVGGWMVGESGNKANSA